MTWYIQRCDGRTLETVDEFTTHREARAMVAEYRLSDPSASYYVSSRCCKAWRADRSSVDIDRSSGIV